MIRAAAPAELETIYRMGYDAWGGGLDLDAYLAACRASKKYARGTWWILPGEAGEPVAALLAHEIALPDGDPAIGLGSIATSPELRRRGLASTLIREALSLHEARGAAVFFLFSDIAPAFYERFGFKILQDRLMARADEALLSSVLAHPKFVRPDYF